jgi:hypothetical protein
VTLVGLSEHGYVFLKSAPYVIELDGFNIAAVSCVAGLLREDGVFGAEEDD